MKRVEEFLRGDIDGEILDRKVITNIKFYVAAVVAKELVSHDINVANGLNKIDSIQLEDAEIKQSYKNVIDTFLALGGTDQVAKRTALVATLKG